MIHREYRYLKTDRHRHTVQNVITNEIIDIVNFDVSPNTNKIIYLTPKLAIDKYLDRK